VEEVATLHIMDYFNICANNKKLKILLGATK